MPSLKYPDAKSSLHSSSEGIRLPSRPSPIYIPILSHPVPVRYSTRKARSLIHDSSPRPRYAAPLRAAPTKPATMLSRPNDNRGRAEDRFKRLMGIVDRFRVLMTCPLACKESSAQRPTCPLLRLHWYQSTPDSEACLVVWQEGTSKNELDDSRPP